MSIDFSCSTCGKNYHVPEEKAGKRFRCRKCDTPVRVPESDLEEFDEYAAPLPRRGDSRVGNKRRSGSGSNRGFVIAGSVAGVLLFIGVAIFVVFKFVGRMNRFNDKIASKQEEAESPAQQHNDFFRGIDEAREANNRNMREMQEAANRSMYGDVTRAEKQDERELSAKIIISGVTKDQKRAEIYLRRKIGSLASRIAQKEREKINKTNENTKKAAEQKARDEGRIFYQYEIIRKYVGTRVTLENSADGEYVYRVSPVTDLQEFARKTGFGKILSVGGGSRVIRIQSTLPDPAPDFDYETLKEKHGREVVAAVLLSNPGEINLKKYHFIERELVSNLEGDSRFLFGPKDYGDGRLFYIVGPVRDLSNYSAKLDLGSAKSLENSQREISVNVALSVALRKDLPEPLANYDLTRPDDGGNQTALTVSPRSIAHTPYDRSPQPLEEHIEWVVRILTAEKPTAAVDDVARDIPDLPVDERYLTVVSDALSKRLKDAQSRDIELIVKALIAWKTDRGIQSILGLLQDSTASKRAIAIKALSAIKTREVATALVKRLGDEEDYMQTCVSLKLLGPVAEEAVLPLLSHDTPRIRGTACNLMGAVGGEKGLARTKALTRDRENNIKEEAKSSVLLIEDRLAATQTEAQKETAAEINRLILEIRNGDVDDVSVSLNDLNSLEIDATRKNILITVLQAKLAESRRIHERGIITAIAAWKDESVVPIIGSIYRDKKHPHDSKEAIQALETIPFPQAADLIASRLGDFFDKRQALEALKSMGPAAEATGLRLARKSDPDTKAVGCHILASVGTEKSILTLKKVARGKHKNLAALARRALQAVESRLASNAPGENPFKRVGGE